jgi:NAD(P)-dependent dehydrogenase (short-subunit alcohol dehydrogenase family)
MMVEIACRRLEGNVAIVTGAAAGIGRAIALRLGAEGATVVVVDQRADQGSETVATLRERGSEADFIECDVSVPEQVEAMVAIAAGMRERIDVLVNNAGIPGALAPVDQLSVDDWDRVIAVNLRGVFLCCKYAVPHLAANSDGVVVNIASMFGLVGAHNLPAYCAAKGGVIGLTKQLAVDYGPRGVRVNAVCPGYVDNDMDQRRERMAPEDAARNLAARETAASLQPVGRQADVAEIAATAAFLASRDAAFVTGAIIPVDGGATAHFNLGSR